MLQKNVKLYKFLKPREWLIWYSCLDTDRRVGEITRAWYPKTFSSSPLRMSHTKNMIKKDVIKIEKRFPVTRPSFYSKVDWLKPFLSDIYSPCEKEQEKLWSKGYMLLFEKRFRQSFFGLKNLLVLFNNDPEILHRFPLLPLKMPKLLGSMSFDPRDKSETNIMGYDYQFFDLPTDPNYYYLIKEMFDGLDIHGYRRRITFSSIYTLIDRRLNQTTRAQPGI